MKIIVTGGLGFIGSALIRKLAEQGQQQVTILNIDKMTYAANQDAVNGVDPQYYQFLHADVANGNAMRDAIQAFSPDIVMHLAAESHVDRSIASAAEFVRTNVVGTYVMLESAMAYWNTLNQKKKESFRFIHVSTDEVYGDLEMNDPAFTEKTPYAPNSPYSASKAASDHFARAWFKTFGFPVIITHCSNNYGIWQADEKFIPTVIRNALMEKPIPIYGKGANVRDWIHVNDHVDALMSVADKGVVGETYNIGGNTERDNLTTVHAICSVLDKAIPRKNGHSYSELITFVADRLGHDFRYAINNDKIEKVLGWKPQTTFEEGLTKTVAWYINKYQGR